VFNTVIPSLQENNEILDDERRGKIQTLSKNVPEQNVDVLPLVSSENSLEQNVSFCFGLHSLFPFLFKNRKCSLKFFRWMKFPHLFHHNLVVCVGHLDHWLNPCEEQLTAAVSSVMGLFTLKQLRMAILKF
jgi:hypothetical protein